MLVITTWSPSPPGLRWLGREMLSVVMAKPLPSMGTETAMLVWDTQWEV